MKKIFKNDEQRKAVFYNLNKFALKFDPHTGRTTSTEYPNVDFTLFVNYPKEALKALEKIPEQQLSGLGAIVADEYTSKGKILAPKLAVYTTGIPIYGNDERGNEISMIRTASPENIAGFYEEHPEKGSYGFSDVLAHEVGHHVTSNVLGKTKVKSDKGSGEVVADKFMQEYTGAVPKNKPRDEAEEEALERAYSYLETLQELKTPSVKDLSKYSGEFSFDERKRKGWYPESSHLPKEFPDIVRGIAMDIIIKDSTYTRPDDAAQVARMTGEVCQELDKIWKPEWGKRPDGYYLKADVKDAFEDLD
jgi:hypothetical protein